MNDQWTDRKGEAFNTKLVGQIAEVADQGHLVKFKMPFSPGLYMMMDRRMIDHWVGVWTTFPEEERPRAIRECETAIKRAHKRQKRGKLTPDESDRMANDIAIWMAFQIAFKDGSNLIEPVKNIGGLGLRGSMN